MFVYHLANGLLHAANVDGFFSPSVPLNEFIPYLRAQGVCTAYLNLHPCVTDQDYLAKAEVSPALIGIQQLSLLPTSRAYPKSIRQKLKHAENADWVPVSGEQFEQLYQLQHYVDEASAVRLNPAVKHCEWVGLATSTSEFSYACFGIGDGVVEYLLAASSDSGRSLQAGLLYRMMQQYEQRGFEIMNMGGGIAPGDGLEQYKLRLAGAAVPKRTVKLVIDEATFREASAGSEPGSRFPPYF